MGVKLTKRKGFNFFRSYYDVYNELETKEDKVAFIEALLDRQFLGVKPLNLKGMAKFAYISQTNSIDSQVKGYEDKTGIILTPTVGGDLGGSATPAIQVQVEDKEQGKEKLIITIEERKLKFASTLKDFNTIYSRDLLKDFYEYWTEPNKSNTKFRQESEKTWSLERRLKKWKDNENKFNNNKIKTDESITDIARLARLGLLNQ